MGVTSARADLIARWTADARQRRGRVVLPEGGDPRVAEAASRLAAEEVCEVHIIGPRPAVEAAAVEAGWVLHEAVVVHEPSAIVESGDLPAFLGSVLQARGLDPSRLAERLSEPVSLGAAMVRRGDVDACVAGATTESARVLRAGIQVVGTAPGRMTVSSAESNPLSAGSRWRCRDRSLPGRLAQRPPPARLPGVPPRGLGRSCRQAGMGDSIVHPRSRSAGLSGLTHCRDTDQPALRTRPACLGPDALQPRVGVSL